MTLASRKILSGRLGFLLPLIFITSSLLYLDRRYSREAPGILPQHIQDALQVLPPATNTSPAPLIPAEYLDRKAGWCEKAFGLGYLDVFRSNHHGYCNAQASASQLECFSGHIREKEGDYDSFCIASSVLVQKPVDGSKEFHIDCTLNEWTPDMLPPGAQMPPPLSSFPTYMFDTGPGYLLRQYFSMSNTSVQMQPAVGAAMHKCAKKPKSNEYTVLIKRDGGSHHWHSLMEFIAFFLTLDIMRVTPKDGKTGLPFATMDDLKNMQIVFLDGHPDGPFVELWNLFANKPIIRIDQLTKGADEPLCLDNVLLPFAGSNSPLWIGDWVPLECSESALIDMFSQRVLTHYAVDGEKRPADAPLVLTFVNRVSRRRLKDQDQHLDRLRAKFPKVTINAVNFADFPWTKQLEIASQSDILVGVHGAGLTLQMFMPRGSSVVEIQPSGLQHWGFRNLAAVRRNHYFRVHAKLNEKTGGFQEVKEIDIEENKFMAAVEAAIYASYHRGVLGDDVL